MTPRVKVGEVAAGDGEPGPTACDCGGFVTQLEALHLAAAFRKALQDAKDVAAPASNFEYSETVRQVGDGAPRPGRPCLVAGAEPEMPVFGRHQSCMPAASNADQWLSTRPAAGSFSGAVMRGGAPPVDGAPQAVLELHCGAPIQFAARDSDVRAASPGIVDREGGASRSRSGSRRCREYLCKAAAW